MDIQLKPCPFCGNVPQMELFFDGFFHYARITCCHLVFDWCEDKTGEKAAAAWNRRAESTGLTPEQVAALQADRDAWKRRAEAAEQDLIDYASSGTDNFSPYCANVRPECVDGRGWCIKETCKRIAWKGPKEGADER